MWGRFQRSGSLRPQTALPTVAPLPATLVVFSGNAAAARAFAAETGLDPAQTVLLPDPTMRVTTDLYHADPCPRLFVLDGRGVLRYTNNHKDDAAREVPEMVIASRALDALRACKSIPAKKAATPFYRHKY